MTKIAKLISEIKFQSENSETQNTKFEIKDCEHERRGVRIPPIIRTVKDFYDNATYEFCKDCEEITRIKNL